MTEEQPSLRDGFEWASLAPELIVSDLAKSLIFWHDLIGFQIVYERTEQSFVYLELGNAQVMLAQADGMTRWAPAAMEYPFGRGLNLQIAVEDVDVILGRLKDKGWPLFIPPEIKWHRARNEEAGTIQFAVADPDGYLLKLCQSLGRRPISSME